MVIGVTGGSGSGKSTLSHVAKQLGFAVVCADRIGHQVMRKGMPAYDEIVAAFGTEYLGETGEIDRKRLGALVFSDADALQRLNRIVHPRITQEVERQLAGHANAIIDAAVLHLTPLYQRCDRVVAVQAPIDARIERLRLRDGLCVEAAKKRIASQPDDAQYAAMADVVLVNDGTEQQFMERARRALVEVMG